jgi:GntR family galactonate operon transcriptional repressor
MTLTRPRRAIIGRGLHGSVLESLGRSIVSGRFPEGAVLPVEGDLSLGMDVSRTVIREAIRVLAAKGLVEARPMRGTTVRPRRDWRLLDPDVLRWWVEVEGEATILHDLLEVRAFVEPAAARIAAQRATPADRAEIEGAWRAFAVSADDVGRFIEADLRLHGAILAACGNAILDELFEPISATLRLGRQVQARVATDELARLRDSMPLHERAVRAILDGRPAAAERAMRELVEAAARDAELVLGVRPADGIPR